MRNPSSTRAAPVFTDRRATDRSLINLPLLGVPASLAFGYVASTRDAPLSVLTANSFGSVYMICAVGVYV